MGRMTTDRERLRRTFDEDALLYDRARPHYPDVLFDAIDRVAPGRRTLEIGCGTGQATAPLAARGYEVTALELGASMAEVARANLASYSTAEVVNEDFERWEGPERAFDLVVSATAFHWIDPATRVDRVARALRPAGVFALIDTVHVAGTSNTFFVEAQHCYERWDPAALPGLRLPAPDELPPPGDHELDHAEQFDHVELQRFGVKQTYTSDQYLDLLSTFSGHRSLPVNNLVGLFDCLRQLIECKHAGKITKSYVFELRTATHRRQPLR
jgi:SAM-dependent methyltransferase